MAISKVNEETLNRCSRQGVEARFENIVPVWQASRWLGAANKYGVNTVKILDSDLEANALNEADAADYIAASAIPHCFDGWGYLGHALSALMAGDPHASRHFGYYAELRAAMSVLACEGVGVFDDSHLAVLDPGSASICCKFPSKAGTHAFAWEVFDAWAKLPRATQLLTRVVRIGSQSLGNWVDSLPSKDTVNQLLSNDLIRHWGLDLNNFEADRRTRNTWSYRPTALTSDASPTPLDVASFAHTIWDLAEPIGESRFRLIDRFILRRVIQLYLRSVFGLASNDPIRKQYRRSIDTLLDIIGTPPELTRDGWIDFLLGNTHLAEPNPLQHAAVHVPPGGLARPFEVLSRAFLLLRLATGACYDLLDVVRSSCSPSVELAFWWHTLGESRGLWPKGSPPTSASDLWTDIDEAIRDLRNIATSGKPLESTHDFQTTWQDSVTALTGTERIGLWGLGL